MNTRATLLAAGLLAAGTASAQDLRQQVFESERAFARSMAERDPAAFAKHVSEQAVFFNGETPIVGKAAIVAAWKPYYEGAKAPFSWEPDQVVVLADGTLAHSTGPVRDENGRITHRFNSIWRQESPGLWRVVFDKGAPLSEAQKKAAAGG
jgi:ketosteroid isomerase-like protein